MIRNFKQTEKEFTVQLFQEFTDTDLLKNLNKIGITGGDGFIGSNFPYGIHITRKDVDLLDLHELTQFLQTHNIKYLIHTAGKIGGVLGNLSDKGAYFFQNNIINTNVLEACRIAGVEHVISLLSTCIYPANVEPPYKESDLHLGPPFDAHEGYAYAKRMLEVQSRIYREQYGLDYRCAVLPNIYGPGDHFGNEHGHVIPSLITKAIIARDLGSRQDLVVWGDGTPKREVMFVWDVVKVVTWMLFHETEPLLNIGPGTQGEYTVADIAAAIATVFACQGNITFDKTKPNGQISKASDNSAICKIFSMSNTLLTEGLLITKSYLIESGKYQEIVNGTPMHCERTTDVRLTDRAELLDKAFQKVISSLNKAEIKNANIQYTGSESVGELLEKLIILNIRIWILEDDAAAVKNVDDKLYATLKKKLDVCFKTLRPRIVAALDSALLNIDVENTAYKYYKNEQ